MTIKRVINVMRIIYYTTGLAIITACSIVFINVLHVLYFNIIVLFVQEIELIHLSVKFIVIKIRRMSK